MVPNRAVRKSAKKKKTIKLRAKAKPMSAKRPVAAIVSTKRLLSSPEGLEVDFKRSADAVTQDDLVAFANAGGGTILVGVDETRDSSRTQRGKVVGCDVSDRERNKIVSRASDCRPAIHVRVVPEVVGDKRIFRITIHGGGLHCTASGMYKIRRDGQIGIIDPTAMTQMVVSLERPRLIRYLRDAVRPEIESSQSDIEGLVEDARAEMDDLRAELDDVRGGEDIDHDFSANDHDEW
jgi:ATP-dependent DNA helicase RecG